MSAETIAIVISAAGLLLGFVSAFAWLIARMDKGFERQDGKIESVRQEIGDRLTNELGDLRKDLGDRISGVERELVEVKIAVARIEGPGRHLIAAR